MLLKIRNYEEGMEEGNNSVIENNVENENEQNEQNSKNNEGENNRES